MGRDEDEMREWKEEMKQDQESGCQYSEEKEQDQPQS